MKTTGWTEETRNQFHPGDIISCILGHTGFSPYNAVGMTELATHFLGEGREFCQPHITDDGQICGFYFNVVPRIIAIESDLKKAFPELAAYADALDKDSLDEKFSTEAKHQQVIQEVEAKFGKKIIVLPRNVSKEDAHQEATDSQAKLLQELVSSGVKTTMFVLPEEDSSGVEQPSSSSVPRL